MTLPHAIDVLDRYNRWRKGIYARSPSPQEFGEAVDVVLKKLIADKKPKKDGSK